jgi:hypothetical protein
MPTLQDCQISPDNLIVNPFEKRIVTITYKPTHAVSSSLQLDVLSVYSHYQIPVKLHSGIARLQLEPEEIDFGHFEMNKNRRTFTKAITFRNTGTMAYGFKINRLIYGDTENQSTESCIQLSRWDGVVPPNDTYEIIARYIMSQDGVPPADNLSTSIESEHIFEEVFNVEGEVLGDIHQIVVRGHRDCAMIDPECLKSVAFGKCLIGDSASRTFTLSNIGGYPLGYELKATYPLKVEPCEGQLGGHATSDVNILWRPMGPYEMHSVVKLVTSAGTTYDLHIRGEGVFPTFNVNTMHIDFGVCAVGYEYRENFEIINNGTVNVQWSVPTISAGFRLSLDRGLIRPGHRQKLKLFFKPCDIGSFQATFMVESRGRYRVMSAVGVGGRLALSLESNVVDFGNCGCSTISARSMKLVNSGTVTMELHFSAKVENDDGCKHKLLVSPSSKIVLQPKQSCILKMLLQASNTYEGPIKGVIRVSCAESSWAIRIAGNAVKVRLSNESRNMLRSENLSVLKLSDPSFERLARKTLEIDGVKEVLDDIVGTLEKSHHKGSKGLFVLYQRLKSDAAQFRREFVCDHAASSLYAYRPQLLLPSFAEMLSAVEPGTSADTCVASVVSHPNPLMLDETSLSFA